MKYIKRFIIIILIISIAISQISCDKLSKQNNNTIINKINKNEVQNFVNKSINKEQLNIAVLQSNRLNPIFNLNKEIYYIFQLCYEPIISYNKNGYTLILAESIVNENKKVIKIKLKDNIYFHNGKKMDAYDVLETYNLRYKINNPYFKALLNYINYIKVESRLILKINFKYASAMNMLILTKIPIINFDKKLIYNKDYIPYGTGPYKIENVQSKEYIFLEANNQYYKGVPHIRNIKVFLVKDKDYEYNLFKKWTTDLLICDQKIYSNDFSDELYKKEEYITNIFELIIFNNKSYPTSRNDVRQKIYSLIDLSKILNSSYNNQIVHSYYPIFNGYLDFKNVPEKKEVNIKKLWKNNVIILTNIENRNRVELCYQLKDLLEQNDFKVELKIVDFDQFNECLENGDFNLAICGLKLDYFIDFNSIKEIFGNYLSNMWIYADVDKTEKDKLFENINNINQKMADYMPFIGLGFRKGEIIYDKRISLPITPYFTSPLNNAELWKVISQ